jgi:thiol-disulfide isomerase/thioredoxin
MTEHRRHPLDIDTPRLLSNAASRRRRLTVSALMLAALIAALPPVAIARSERPIGATLRQDRLRDALRRHVLQGLEGETLSVGSLQGEVVVINFWASWCRPCRRELPFLDSLHRDLVKQGGRVIAVSIDMNRDNVRRFVREQSLGLPVFHDGPQQLARWIDLDRIPFTVVLDRSGEIAFTTSDAASDGLSELGTVTRRLLAQKAPATAAPAAAAPASVETTP